MDEKEKIREVLASQEKQLEVDVIRIVEQNNVKEDKREKAIELVRKDLMRKRQENYPVDDENERLKKRQYTQTFREELENEQEAKIREKHLKEKQVKKALEAYGQQERGSLIDEMQKKHKKSIIENIIETLKGLKQETPKQENRVQNLKTHSEFMKELQKNTETTENKDISMEKQNITKIIKENSR